MSANRPKSELAKALHRHGGQMSANRPKSELAKAFYSPGEVARLLDLHPDTVLNYIHSGRVFAIRLSARTYRVPQREVQRLIAPETLRPPRIIHRQGDAALREFRERVREEVEAVERRRTAGTRSRA